MRSLNTRLAEEPRASPPQVQREQLADVAFIERAWRASAVPERRAIVAALVQRVELQAGAPPRLAFKTPEQLVAA